MEILTNFDFDTSEVENASVSLVNGTQTLRYYMDRELWAKRTASWGVWGPGKKLGLNQFLDDFRFVNFDFEGSEVEKASVRLLHETQTLR